MFAFTIFLTVCKEEKHTAICADTDGARLLEKVRAPMNSPLSNRILRCLPIAMRNSLLERMEEVTLPTSTTLCRPREVPKYAHFMTSGITSVVTFMANGKGVEVGLIGREGLVEAFHLLGPSPSPSTAFLQSQGTALRMPFADLKAEFQSNEPLRALILRFVQSQGMMANQLAACNRLHEIEARLARWLLMVSDRVEGKRFYVTQEFLAEMIGAQRSTVTIAAGSLQRNGYIEYRRGHVHILDREGLERAACECYPVVRELVSDLYTVQPVQLSA